MASVAVGALTNGSMDAAHIHSDISSKEAVSPDVLSEHNFGVRSNTPKSTEYQCNQSIPDIGLPKRQQPFKNSLQKSPESWDSEFARDIRVWLSAPQEAFRLKYLYDAEGSRLFEEVTRTNEYYLTRTETTLLKSIAADLSAAIPAGAVLVEYGSGACVKTRIVLDAAPQLSTFVPIDISPTALDEAAKAIAADYPHLRVAPLLGDYLKALKLPRVPDGAARVGFFPGSTIGNFTDDQAREFLRSARSLLGDDAAFIVGFDIVQDEATMVNAYSDAAGIMHALNKNILARINRDLDGDFDLSAFGYEAVWNRDKSRVEQQLVSLRDQIVHAAGEKFRLSRNERLHAAYSYKFTLNQFEAIVADAGWTTQRRWVSDAPKFAMSLLKASKKPFV